jgi:hypothetical protein
MTRSMHQALWHAPIEPLALGATEVHIWHARLDLPAPDLQALEQTLAADDPQPASAFRFARDRLHFICNRTRLCSWRRLHGNRNP